MGDVWEIGVLAPVARERTGYPSQKPEALLERLVLALSDPGDLVLDPYAGSGTTLAVAAKLGRRFLGLDQSDVAIETTLRRLEEIGVVLARHDAAARDGVRPGSVACVERPGTLTVPGAKGPTVRRARKRPKPTPEAATMAFSRVR